jgi:hypothetical protein
MNRQLAKITARCRQHESPNRSCDVCKFTISMDAELNRLRVRRSELITELRKRLEKKEIILTEIA